MAKTNLIRMPEVAKLLGLAFRYTHRLSVADETFPSVAERIGTIKFYQRSDIARYARSRKSKKRWHK